MNYYRNVVINNKERNIKFSTDTYSLCPAILDKMVEFGAEETWRIPKIITKCNRYRVYKKYERDNKYLLKAVKTILNHENCFCHIGERNCDYYNLTIVKIPKNIKWVISHDNNGCEHIQEIQDCNLGILQLIKLIIKKILSKIYNIFPKVY
jgi:hypothetical protein